MLDTFPICGAHLQPGQFSTRIAQTDTVDFRHFILTDSVEYFSLAGVLYRLPRYAPTDLASIPKELWSLLPPAGEDGAEYGLAAFGHDCCYQDTLLVWPSGSMPSGTPIPNDNTGWIKASLSKSDSDLLLKEMMLACKVPDLIAEAIYQGVNLGGSGAFKKDRS
jgi:hypothetical protein